MDPETRRRLQNEFADFKRDVNLVAYAESLGYQVAKRESSRASKVLRCPTTNDKVVVARDARDQHWTYFSVRDARDNGTVIDFIQHRSPGADLGQVREELRRWTNTVAPHVATSEAHRVWPSQSDRIAAAATFARALKVTSCSYLQGRGLRPETLQHPRFTDTWRVAAPYGNVIFAHRDEDGISGFEAKNKGFTGFSKGGIKSLWQSRAEASDQRLVICESAIDALSYHQLHQDPHTRYVSVAGAVSCQQRRLLLRACAALPPASVVIGAFDADVAGDKFYQELRASAEAEPLKHVSWRRHCPAGDSVKDWNDVLQTREREYIAGLARHSDRNIELSGMSR